MGVEETPNAAAAAKIVALRAEPWTWENELALRKPSVGRRGTPLIPEAAERPERNPR